MDDSGMFSINNQDDRFFKIISIIGFLLILAVLAIIVRIGPAQSYEFSIYDAYPGYFWIGILSAILCGQVVIIGSAFSQSKKNYWIFGLFVILISNALLLFMPIIRGYYIYGDADVLTHIGYMKDILRTSSIGKNHYPIDHILGVIIHIISGLSLPDITLIIPLFFSFFFIMSMYFVGKTIFQSKFELLILLVLTSILTLGNFHTSFTPNSQAFLLVPLILYLAFKMYQGLNNKKYTILLFLISFLIVFYHPLVTVMVVLILGIMQIMQYILVKYENRVLKKVNYIYNIFFIVTVFSIWSTYLNMATNVIQPIISRIFRDENIQSELQKNIDIISQVNIDPIYLLKLIFNTYGQWILLGILSLLCIGLILKSMENQKTKPDFYKGMAIMGFLVFMILSIALFLIINRFGFGRIYSQAIIFSLLLIPMGIYILFMNQNSNPRSRKPMTIFFMVIFVFFCITYFSTFNLYFSPIIKAPNLQSPESDHIGMSTFFSYRDESLTVLDFGLVSYRFYDAIYGHSVKRVNIAFGDPTVILPDHFGYQNETLSQNFYNNSKYLLVNDHGRGFYSHIYPEFKNNWRFIPEDFERINFDTKIQKVYSNRNLEIFIL